MRIPAVAAWAVITATARGVVGKVSPIPRLRDVDEPSPPMATFDTPIDHFGGYTGTFQNRYWYNDSFWQAGGPVIVFDAGEQNAELLVDYLLEPEGSNTVVMRLAQRYHGLAILLEHRYYGSSLPFDDSQLTGTGNYTFNAESISFLTVDQALEDVVTFANNFALPANASAAGRVNGQDALRPSKTPWIFVGASYPGMRAALLRVRNPEVIYASWASSAPVQSMVNGYGYWDQVERALPTNCSKDIISAIQYADAALSSSNTSLASEVVNTVYDTISGGGPASVEPFTIGGLLEAPFSIFQMAGLSSVLPLCENIETDFNKSNPSAAGVAASLGSEVAFQRYVAAAGFWTNTTLPTFLNNIWEPVVSPQVGINEPIDSSFWPYQVCSEFGDFQVANPDAAQSIISKFISVDWQQQQCTNLSSGIPSSPAIDHINKYGGWNMTPSQTFFSNGEHDPWRAFGVASVEPGAPVRQATTTVPPAGFSFSNGSYFGVIYPGQVHASDMYNSSNNSDGRNAAFEQGLQMFTQALDVWLPAFSTNSTTANGTAPTSTPAPKTRNAGAKTSNPWMWSSLVCIALISSLA